MVLGIQQCEQLRVADKDKMWMEKIHISTQHNKHKHQKLTQWYCLLQHSKLRQ